MEAPNAASIQERRRVLLGVAVWLAFCAVLILLRGVRWDETFEDAQILLRKIAYPEGHPRFIYCRNAFSAQTYSAAALLGLGAGPALLCGIRNWISLSISVLPVFLLGSLVTRKAVWGHVAALLALYGIYQGYETTYPMNLWPGLYSYGQIGMGYALLVLYFVLAGHWATGFLLLGLMPCVHLGQMPIVLLVSCVCWSIAFFSKRHAHCKRAVAGGAAGALLTLAFAGIHHAFKVPLPTSGAYYSAEDSRTVWSAFTYVHDIHRQMPRADSHIVLFGALLLGAAALYIYFAHLRKEAGPAEGNRPPVPVYLGLVLYCAFAALTVWGGMFAREAMGRDVPFWLASWMPFRLGNHVAPLLFVLVLGLLAETWKRGANDTAPTLALIGLAAGYAAAVTLENSLLAAVDGESNLLSRYLATGYPLYFGLYGVVMGLLPIRLRERRLLMLPYAFSVVAAFSALMVVHQFGAACFVAGVAAGFAIRSLPRPVMDGMRFLEKERVVLVMCVILAAAIAYPQWRTRQWLPRKPFNVSIARALDERNDPHGVLLGPMTSLNMQAETGHAVLAQQDTPYMISYIPELGPSIAKMYDDLFGVTFGIPSKRGLARPVDWKWELWENVPQERWQELAALYGFRYVTTAGGVSLQLPVIAGDANGKLFAVP